jgi:hypothetical protein
MFTNDLSEDAAQQANVFAERFGQLSVGAAGFRSGHGGALVGHPLSIYARPGLAHLDNRR